MIIKPKSNQRCLEEQMITIAHRYFYSRKQLRKAQDFIPISNLVDSKINYIEFVNRVNTAYISLEDQYQKIIKNEFFNIVYPSWWKEEYNKEIFKINKTKAMEKFILKFNN